MNWLTRFIERERSTSTHAALLAATLLLAYGSSLVASFAVDDLILLKNAQESTWTFAGMARSFHLGAEDLSDGWIPTLLQEYKLIFFRPVFMALLKFETELWGAWTPGYHISNLLLQFCVILLVYRWSADFKLEKRYSFLAALLFVLYLPNLMAVNWVAGRTEIMAALFSITSVAALGRFYTSRKWTHYALSFGAALLALGTKENAVMIPFLHVVSAAFLYGPRQPRTHEIKRPIYAIVPFFILLPIYFAIRSWALHGFPAPPAGFNYHSPGGPGFAQFLLTKVAHTVLTLVFQLPALAVPAVLERSIPIIVVSAALAALTAFYVIRWVHTPLRYFLLGWVALSLAPTVLIGFNPVYYYLASPVMCFVYAHAYRAYAHSSVAWRRRCTHVALHAAIATGLLAAVISGPIFRQSGALNRSVAASVREVLAQHPRAETVYLLDLPAAACYFLVPEVRLFSEAYDETDFCVLNLSSSLLRAVNPSLIQQDEFTFDAVHETGTFFATGLEQIVFAKDVIEFQTNASYHHSGYDIGVLALEEASLLRDDPAWLQVFRTTFRLPPDEQQGIAALRYRFSLPLRSDRHLFLRVVGDHVEPVRFNGRKETGRDSAMEEHRSR